MPPKPTEIPSWLFMLAACADDGQADDQEHESAADAPERAGSDCTATAVNALRSISRSARKTPAGQHSRHVATAGTGSASVAANLDEQQPAPMKVSAATLNAAQSQVG